MSPEELRAEAHRRLDQIINGIAADGSSDVAWGFTGWFTQEARQTGREMQRPDPIDYDAVIEERVHPTQSAGYYYPGYGGIVPFGLFASVRHDLRFDDALAQSVLDAWLADERLVYRQKKLWTKAQWEERSRRLSVNAKSRSSKSTGPDITRRYP